jgi:uncharacterized membrane protein
LADPLLVTVLAIGHVVSAIGWLGASLLSVVIIGPGLQTLSAPSRLEFVVKIIPKMLRYISGMIVGTFLFGLLLLYFSLDGDFALMSPATTFGASLSAGVAIGVITAVLAFAVIFPSFSKTVSIAEGVLKSAGQPPPPEMAKYADRARVSSMAGMFLLLIVVAMMVTAGFY